MTGRYSIYPELAPERERLVALIMKGSDELLPVIPPRVRGGMRYPSREAAAAARRRTARDKYRRRKEAA